MERTRGSQEKSCGPLFLLSLLSMGKTVLCVLEGGRHAMSEETKIAVTDKYSLSIKEAAQYFSIGIKKMRRLAEDNLGDFAVYSGNRYLIIRSKFEEYLQNTSSI